MYLTRFDPWKSRMCTCPPKYSLSPYTGCGHACLYCYITSYISNAFKPRKKKNFLNVLKKELKKCDRSMFISMSNSSDPYTPPEREEKITRSAIAMIINAGMPLQIVTKSDLVCRDIDLLKKGKTCVAITVTTMNTRIAKKIEPFAPEPEKRIKALKKVSSEGIPTSLRFDPIIPGINDNIEAIEDVIYRGHLAGVRMITCSTFKGRVDAIERMKKLPEFIEYTLPLLTERHGRVLYLTRKKREEIIKCVKEVCDSFSLEFSTCREGLSNLSTAKSCDGSHLMRDISSINHRKNTSKKLL